MDIKACYNLKELLIILYSDRIQDKSTPGKVDPGCQIFCYRILVYL